MAPGTNSAGQLDGGWFRLATLPLPDGGNGRGATWSAVLHGSVGGAHSPLPRSGSCNADGLRASQLQHAVQSMDGNVHLGHPTLVRAAAQSVTDHLLEPADGGFDAGSGGVAGRLLPSRSSVLSDGLQMAIPLRRRGLSRLAWHGRGTRRHDDRSIRMTLGDCGGNAFLVVGAVAGEGGDRSVDLVEQGADLGAIIDV